MHQPRHPQRPALVMIVSSQEWHARSIESILGPLGYAVMRAYNGKQALERVKAGRPDAIILDVELPDATGLEICVQLRELPDVPLTTPILMTCSGHPNRQLRLEALRAGAWDFIGPSLDGEEFPLRLGAFVQAKMEADRLKDESLLDEATGLYNFRGVVRRAREVSSQAFREQDSLTCIIITPAGDAAATADVALVERLAQVLRKAGRAADIIGTVGPGTFAIVAQGMGEHGVDALARRLSDASAAMYAEPIPIALGFESVANYTETPVDPRDLLTRAASALRDSRNGGHDIGPARIHRFSAATPVH